MKYFVGAILFAYFIATLANSTVKPTKEAHCNVNNNYNSFYAGPNCKKIEQQLGKIRQEMRKVDPYCHQCLSKIPSKPLAKCR